MKYHPYSDIWPLMSGEDFEKLKADIKANGLRMNVITYKDMVLDGRNRERACEAVGVTTRYADAGVSTDDDALKLVASLNEHRRHLSIAQRAFAAEALATLRNGSNQYRAKEQGCSAERPSSSDTKTLRDAADLIGVSYGSVARARAIRQHGNENDVADIVAGRKTLNATAIKVRALRKSRTAKPQPLPRPKLVSNTVVNQPPKHLTPKEVDPEFCGTALDFAAKYGHVNQHTAEEYATMRFDDLVSDMKTLVKRCREFPERKTVDSNWLRNPNPRSVAQLTEALDYLRPKIAEAEALLARAVSALREKK
jgi:hypothetical protein